MGTSATGSLPLWIPLHTGLEAVEVNTASGALEKATQKSVDLGDSAVDLGESGGEGLVDLDVLSGRDGGGGGRAGNSQGGDDTGELHCCGFLQKSDFVLKNVWSWRMKDARERLACERTTAWLKKQENVLGRLAGGLYIHQRPPDREQPLFRGY